MRQGERAGRDAAVGNQRPRASARELSFSARSPSPRPALPPERAKLMGSVVRARCQSRSRSVRPRRRIRKRPEAPLTMKASMTKQGMSPAITPNKNHWYASITFRVKAAHAERPLIREADC